MEMPFHLRTLPPEALAIIGFYKRTGVHTAVTEALMDGTGLSERSYGKAIRRLVTKGYLTMDGNGRYRLTEFGQQAVRDYEDTEGGEGRADETGTVERRLVVALPQPLVAGRTATAYVGFREDENQLLSEPTTLLLRVSVLNGEPANAVDFPVSLDNGDGWQEVEITAGSAQRSRLRVEVFQLSDDDAVSCGGLYVDTDVMPFADQAEPRYAAYGSDVTLISGTQADA